MTAHAKYRKGAEPAPKIHPTHAAPLIYVEPTVMDRTTGTPDEIAALVYRLIEWAANNPRTEPIE